MSMYLIGIDVGTSSAKGLIIDEAGSILAQSQVEYSLDTSKENWCEVDPELYWVNVQKIINDLILYSQVSPADIRGIACSSQGETLICVDRNGNPLRKAIVWLDNRSIEEAKAIEQHFGREQIFAKTGQPEVLPLWPATRILWLQKHEPDVFSNTHKFLLVEDFINYKLSGFFISDQSVISSSLYYDIVEKCYWAEMLDFLQISADQLPEVYESGTPIGPLLATPFSFPQCTLVAGSYDHAAGAIGAGNIKSGMITETTGSSMAMVVTMDDPLRDIGLNLPCQLHALPGKYFILPYGQTAGMALKWFATQLASHEMAEAAVNQSDIYDLLTAEAEKIPIGSDGLTMLPHLAGAGSPEFNPDCRGVYAGISLSMGKGHFVRALMESVAAMVYKNILTIESFGFKAMEIRALGGGAKSTLWNQMKADMTGVVINTLRIQETPALGAAILAGKGSGVFSSIDDACNAIVRVKDTFVPQRSNLEAYQKVFRRYDSLYKNLENWWCI